MLAELKTAGRYLLAAWRSPNRRPIWQIALLLVLFPVYLVARAFVEWMDGK